MEHSEHVHERQTLPSERRTMPPRRHDRREEVQSTAKVMTGVSAGEALAGAAAVALTIIALVGILPQYLAAIATICVGAALMIEGGGITSRFNSLRETLDGDTYDVATTGTGVTTEWLGGAAGVTLGILALIGIYPWVLMAIAAVVFGGTFLLGASATQQVENALHRRTAGDSVMHQIVDVSHGSRVLIGIGVGVLGILVLANIGTPIILTLVALLAAGGAELLFGSAFGARAGKVA